MSARVGSPLASATVPGNLILSTYPLPGGWLLAKPMKPASWLTIVRAGFQDCHSRFRTSVLLVTIIALIACEESGTEAPATTAALTPTAMPSSVATPTPTAMPASATTPIPTDTAPTATRHGALYRLLLQRLVPTPTAVPAPPIGSRQNPIPFGTTGVVNNAATDHWEITVLGTLARRNRCCLGVSSP